MLFTSNAKLAHGEGRKDSRTTDVNKTQKMLQTSWVIHDFVKSVMSTGSFSLLV